MSNEDPVEEEEDEEEGELEGELESSSVQKLLLPFYLLIAVFALAVVSIPFIILYSLVRLALSN